MNPWLGERAREVRASIEQIERLRTELGYLQLGWRPPDGGWSIAQVFEHLIAADASYLPRMRKLIESGKRGDTPWRSTFWGGHLIKTVSPIREKKFPAPRIYRPAAEARATVIEEYIKLREELLQLIERADGVDLRRNRMGSPVAAIIRLNLGDAFTVLVRHTQRHMQQIERIRRHPEFPAAN